jgi:hypothetical protein
MRIALPFVSPLERFEANLKTGIFLVRLADTKNRITLQRSLFHFEH